MINYYCINVNPNDDEQVEYIMKEIQERELNLDWVKFVEHPDSDDICETFDYNQVLGKGMFFSGVYHRLDPNDKKDILLNLKHYSALSDFAKSDKSYAVIFEDHVSFNTNVPKQVMKLINDLNVNYSGKWDILFDSRQVIDYDLERIPGTLTYRRSNVESTRHRNGSCRNSSFYILTNSFAKKLVDNFLPFASSLLSHYGHLFDKMGARVFWSQPAFTNSYNKLRKQNSIFVSEKELSEIANVVNTYPGNGEPKMRIVYQ